MTEESAVPQGPRRQRRRRRAVWRPGEAISRTVESDAPARDAAPRPAPPRPPAEAAPVKPEAAKPAGTKPEAAKPQPAGAKPEAAKPAGAKPEAAKPAGTKPEAAKRRGRTDPTERGLRELVGAGSSQLGPVRAMRARDANRPTAADLAQAEEEVVLVRRHWKPPKNGA